MTCFHHRLQLWNWCRSMKSMSEKLLVSLQRVAILFGVCPRTILREVERGNFPKPVKIGKCLRFDENEVLAHLDALKQKRYENSSQRAWLAVGIEPPGAAALRPSARHLACEGVPAAGHAVEHREVLK